MVLKSTKGAISEKAFITHGMGVQIPYCLSHFCWVNPQLCWGTPKNYRGMSFWAGGYFVSTVGADADGFARIFVTRKKRISVSIR